MPGNDLFICDANAKHLWPSDTVTDFRFMMELGFTIWQVPGKNAIVGTDSNK